MLRKGLLATIDSVILFGEKVALNPPILKYFGEPLAVTKIDTDAHNNVTITIDNINQPAASLTLSATPASAVAKIQYDAAKSTSASTAGTLTYNGKPLVLTAEVRPDPAAPKWTNAKVSPKVAGWEAPTGGVEFVILHDGGPSGTLWWLVNPIDTDPSTHSGNFVDGAKGTGLHGPFGLDTP